MKIEIKCRFSGSVLFSHECDGNTIKITVEAAAKAGANLTHANLAGAYLAGAYLAGANLAGANLTHANLAGAYLAGANLAGANLAGANLDGANLTHAYLAGAYLTHAYLAGAYLDGANLTHADLAGADLAGAYLAGAYLAGGEKLFGKRPIFQIGPIGSRCAYFVAFITDKGLRLRAGCFFGSKEEFIEKLQEEHEDNEHAQEYNAAISLIEKHSEIWTPEN